MLVGDSTPQISARKSKIGISLRAANEFDTFVEDLQTQRRAWTPTLPSVLDTNVFTPELGEATTAVGQVDQIKELFPTTFGQPIVDLKPGGQPRAFQPLNVGVVLSGGQAAGGHNCISGLFDYVHTHAPGSRVFGFLGGPKAVVENRTRELDEKYVAKFRNMGGFDMLQSGRDKIETPEQFARARETAEALELDGVVVIGGDDSNTNAAVLAENFKAHGLKTKVVGLPKTIDGDLKNEHIETSFGFDTAGLTYAECVGNIACDTVASSKYYHFIRLMGREASHLTLEVALQCRPNYTLISEEVGANKIPLKTIVTEIADLCEKRYKESGVQHGIVVLPEGLIDFIPEFKPLIAEINEILAKDVAAADVSKHFTPENLEVFNFLPETIQNQLLLDRDPHGNVQVAKIESERLLALCVAKEMAARKPDFEFMYQCHYFGYEGRCALPNPFDSNYCYALGQTAGALLSLGYTGMIASLRGTTGPVEDWQVRGVPLTAMLNIERRKGHEKPVIKKALTELDGAPFKYFAARRDAWKLQDAYRIPGPIQFDKCTLSATLQLEQGIAEPELSDLAEARRSDRPQLPAVFLAPKVGITEREQPTVEATVKAGFPNTAAQPIWSVTSDPGVLASAVEGSSKNADVPALSRAKTRATCGGDAALRIGVVFLGRQCPGGHNILEGLWRMLQERTKGSSLLGFKQGATGLLAGDVIEVDQPLITKFAQQGGFDMFGRSRDVVRTKELDQVVATCEKLDLDGLVVVGGATSNGYAATMAEHLHGKVKTSVIGVPVSIDNGLVGKFCEAMVGFDTAARCYSQLIGNLATDAASAAKYYYFVRVMGRDTSHLAVECALQTGPTMVLTCEEVMSKNMSLSDIVNQIADVVQARKAQGMNYGVIIVPEGLVGCIAEMRLLFKEVAAKAEGLHTPRPQTAAQTLTPWARAVLEGLPPAIQEQVLLSPEESTGGAQLQNIETDRLLAELVQAEVKRRNAKSPFSAVCFYLGYQARGAFPSKYDCVLGSTCGYAAGIFVRERLSGYLATVQRSCQKVEDWTVRAVPLAALLATQPDPYNTKNTRHVCPILPVDMHSTAFLDLQDKREDWQETDAFRNPGPTQFEAGMLRPITLMANTQKAHALLDDVMERCDAIKAALEAAPGDQLHIAQVSLAALQEVLAALGRR